MYLARGFSLTPHTYCIKRGIKHVCVQDTKASYAIGFNNVVIARNIMYNMSPDPDDLIKITRSQGFDVTEEINSGLQDLTIDPEFRVDTMEIDMMASIHIKKRKKSIHGYNSSVPDSGFHISTMDTSDFLLYPLSNSIGIALPLYIEDEDHNSFCLKSVIVEPSYCGPITRANLKKMLD